MSLLWCPWDVLVKGPIDLAQLDGVALIEADVAVADEMQFQGATAKVLWETDCNLLGGKSFEGNPLHSQKLVSPWITHH